MVIETFYLVFGVVSIEEQLRGYNNAKCNEIGAGDCVNMVSDNIRTNEGETDGTTAKALFVFHEKN